MQMPPWLSLMCISLFFVACTNGEEQRETAARVVDEDDGCPEQTVVVRTADLSGEVEGDVDGDEAPDTIGIALDEAADVQCQAFLVARLDSGSAVSEPIWRSGEQGGITAPNIHRVVQLDGAGGTEILVDEAAGASTTFAGAFTFTDGVLERIEPRDIEGDIWSGAAEGLFPYGGSVGHIEGADCADGHDVVVSVALPAGPSENTYAVVRRFFDLEDARLVEQDLQRTIATAQKLFDTFPEFRASPFGSCPG